MNRKVLVIDDNLSFSRSLEHLLKGKGFRVYIASNSMEGLGILATEEIDYVLLDVQLGEEYGPEVLTVLKEKYSDIPVVMLTGFGTIESAVASIKIGAFDYIQKPVKLQRLLDIFENVQRQKAERQNRQPSFSFMTRSPCIEEILGTTERIAPTNIPVLLYGENGTGKEVLADYIQSLSGRRDGPYVKINCASFSDTLLENELFGHERGAYTGAENLYKGVFEKADGGTLFLDEIGDMPLSVQSRVLRVLQNNELYRLGGENLVKVDIRIIAATNRDLEEAIAGRTFRQDLYYRLNAAIISLPPLRDRKEDIQFLAESFLDAHLSDSRSEKRSFSDEVLDLFQRHQWPGNVRELKNLVGYAAALSTGSEICRDDLPPRFLSQWEDGPKGSLLDRTERELILRELKRWNFNKKKAAESLSMSRSTLYSKLRKYEFSD